MLDIKFVVQNKDQVVASLEKRGAVKLLPELDQLLSNEEKRKQIIQTVETLKAERNAASQEIAKLKKSGGDDSAILEKMKGVSQQVKTLDAELAAVEENIKRGLLEFPNILDISVPAGKDATSNKVVRTWGKPPEFSFKPKSHDDIGESLGIIDFKKAGEVSGARFVFLKGLASKLERSLVSMMLESHTARGYEEMLPPFLVNRKALTGTGQLPKFEEDVFRIEKFDYFLIPTAEVPVTNYHCDEILNEKLLTKKYAAYSACFRSEAGSYGKDTKGLKRQHQFNKVELVKFSTPQKSFEELELLVADAEKILQDLNLHYRVVLLCGGDIGFGSAKTYDLEVWCPSVNGFVEISSCSNFTDFQARRANIRYREDASGKVQYVHTLNGSGLAIGRTLLAIMENYQTEDGKFEIPNALKKYF